MPKQIKNIAILMLITMLSGCSSITALYHKQDIVKNRDADYLQSQNVAPLQLPAGVNGAQLGQDYPVTGSAYPASHQPISEIPPGSSVTRVVKPQTSAATPIATASQLTGQSSPALVVAQSPDDVWPKLPSALSNAGYHVVLQDPRISTIYFLDVVQTKYRVTTQTPIYQLHVITLPTSETQLTITDNKNQPVKPAIAQRILRDISKALMGKVPSATLRWWRAIGDDF